MKTLKDHQDTMVSMLASGTAIPTSAIRLAHALHDVLAHLNNTNVAPVAYTERRIDATTPGLNDAMLAQDIAAVKPKQQSLESLLKQRDNTIRQLKGRVSVLRTENKALEQEVLNLREESARMLKLFESEFKRSVAIPLVVEEPAQAGCRKEDTQAEEGGWIEWDGGDKSTPFEYPLPGNTRVEVKGCEGRTYSGYVGEFIWSDNIVAYRVVKP